MEFLFPVPWPEDLRSDRWLSGRVARPSLFAADTTFAPSSDVLDFLQRDRACLVDVAAVTKHFAALVHRAHLAAFLTCPDDRRTVLIPWLTRAHIGPGSFMWTPSRPSSRDPQTGSDISRSADFTPRCYLAEFLMLFALPPTLHTERPGRVRGDRGWRDAPRISGAA